MEPTFDSPSTATPPNATSAPAASGDVIKDSNTQNFEKDVIAASMDVPVIVDFWAPWCGPCKQLGPAIEKAVRAANGRVRLVKIDIDQNQPIAQAMRIQSIPAVFAFVNGQPVDGFVGAQPESKIKAFIEKLAGETGPTPVEQALEQAAAAMDDNEETGPRDIDLALSLYGQVLEQEPENIAAIAGLTRGLIALGDFEAAREALARAPKGPTDPADITSARAALALAEQAAESSGETDALEARVAADGDDHQARYDLAMALFGGGRQADAIEHLLHIMGADRAWNDDGARKQLLVFLEALGFADPLSVETRRKMSTLMFS